MTMPPRLTVMGDLERPDHSHLPANSICYFWGEYTSRKHIQGPGWNASATNQLVANFKKKLDRREYPEWRYKEEAIQRIGNAFSGFWDWNKLHEMGVALVPMPPSKARHDPMFDPRNMQVMNVIRDKTGVPLDIRDCLSFSGAFAASHESDSRPSPSELYAELAFDSTLGRAEARPAAILLFDDVLTTGAHFVAATRKLRDAFPGIDVIGQFVARRQIPDPLADLG
ncbi:hypothetical protein [Ralstonia holmesii]|uniref:hypothetical protein n=1 Tax=Ralstonia holmesii TaxID=3058602 RepID=UPI003F15BF4F